MEVREYTILLLIIGVLTVLLALAVYDNLVSPHSNTNRSKFEVERSKQQDKVAMDSNLARGCIIAEDVGETILWKCPMTK